MINFNIIHNSNKISNLMYNCESSNKKISNYSFINRWCWHVIMHFFSININIFSAKSKLFYQISTIIRLICTQLLERNWNCALSIKISKINGINWRFNTKYKRSIIAVPHRKLQLHTKYYYFYLFSWSI